MSGTEAARKLDESVVQAAPIGEETAERFIAEKHIGERIKRLRLKKSMGLVELGRLTGLSASFLSQLETGRVVPTLRNLARVAMVFSKDLAYFFENDPQPLFRVHRRRERVRLPQTGADHPSYFFESLGFMVPDRQMDPYFAQFLPMEAEAGQDGAGKDGASRTHVHAGCEFLYVLEGRLELRQGENRATLEPGDAVYFDSGTAHSYLCVGDKPASAVIVAMHQTGHQAAPVQAKPAVKDQGTGIREQGSGKTFAKG
jgi:transcriptional regulator with XRE-family HTH domain